ncbi:transcriptional regulator, TetR family [Soonwooa buanensis]|uniref:Transcriptional regulator, TetR family n=1 Tax=Soonwooa buanensis TaxID=619805 RepID=A0A1T5CNS4_9FLAO|nr:TetR family transcriptional regulator [Soonwooa buanensis]SKB61165.1 transcriptional regulator, TetR family [Soonwooa buanensis]
MAKKEIKNRDVSTEEKIKDAAKLVFHKKGYAATRTRDIAEEAGINLALLNYYFRSKEKLFQLIMAETLSGFILQLSSVLNNKKTSLEEKVEQIANNYITFLSKEPEIPIFILSEVRNNSKVFMDKIPLREVVLNSEFIHQYEEVVHKGNVSEPNPLHFLMNVLGLVVFPFIAQPMLTQLGKLDQQQFNQLMEERKKRIPSWIKMMLKA